MAQPNGSDVDETTPPTPITALSILAGIEARIAEMRRELASIAYKVQDTHQRVIELEKSQSVLPELLSALRRLEYGEKPTDRPGPPPEPEEQG